MEANDSLTSEWRKQAVKKVFVSRRTAAPPQPLLVELDAEDQFRSKIQQAN
jgi:hypothetical protein